MAIPDFQSMAARADLCRLLSACYYEPGPEFTEERLFDSLIAAAQSCGDDMGLRAQRLKAAFEGESIEQLLVDYAHLFMGPVGMFAPPYESGWLVDGGDSQGDPTADLLGFYAAGGFEMSDEFRDLPDHIAVQLEFLYSLLFRAAARIQAGDEMGIQAARTLWRDFLDRHLGRWVGDFRAAVLAGAECRFYCELAGMTVELLDSLGDA